MNTLAALLIADSVRTRIEQGDCQTEPQHHRETVEEALCELQRMIAKDLVAAEYVALKRSRDEIQIDCNTLRAANEGLRDSYLEQVRVNKALVAALDDALEYLDDCADVVDGDYGEPAPNKAMLVAQSIRAALKSVQP